jgi:hypothetical protein
MGKKGEFLVCFANIIKLKRVAAALRYSLAISQILRGGIKKNFNNN